MDIKVSAQGVIWNRLPISSLYTPLCGSQNSEFQGRTEIFNLGLEFLKVERFFVESQQLFEENSTWIPLLGSFSILTITCVWLLLFAELPTEQSSRMLHRLCRYQRTGSTPSFSKGSVSQVNFRRQLCGNMRTSDRTQIDKYSVVQFRASHSQEIAENGISG